MERLVSLKHTVLAVTLTAIISINVTSYIFASDNSLVHNELKVFQSEVSYIIFKDGITFKAINDQGLIRFSGTDASIVIQSAIDSTPDYGRVVVKGTVTLTDTLTLYNKKFITLEMENVVTNGLSPAVMVKGESWDKSMFNTIQIKDLDMGGKGIGIIIRDSLATKIFNTRVINPNIGIKIQNYDSWSEFSSIDQTHISGFVSQGIVFERLLGGTGSHSFLGTYVEHLTLSSRVHRGERVIGINISGSVIQSHFEHVNFVAGMEGGEWDAILINYTVTGSVMDNLQLHITGSNRGTLHLFHIGKNARRHIYVHAITKVGTLDPVFRFNEGLNTFGILGEFGGVATEAGVAVLANGETNVIVTLSNPQPTSDYVVMLTPLTNVGNLWVSLKSRTKFTINAETAPVYDVQIMWAIFWSFTNQGDLRS